MVRWLMDYWLVSSNLTKNQNRTIGVHVIPFLNHRFMKKSLGVLDQLRPIAKSYNRTLAHLAINWVLNRKGVTCALIGMMHPWQVDENVQAMDWQLSEKDMIAIDNIINSADLGLRILPRMNTWKKPKDNLDF